MEKQIENQWEEMEKSKMEEYDEKTRQKLLEEYRKKVENQKVISDQLQEFKMRQIKRIQEEMLEGQLIRKQAEEDLVKERQRELERKQRQQEQKEAFKRANEDLVRYQEAQR